VQCLVCLIVGNDEARELGVLTKSGRCALRNAVNGYPPHVEKGA